MYGHVFLQFTREAVQVEKYDLPKPDEADGGYRTESLGRIVQALDGSPLTKFTVANNVNQDDFVRFDGRLFTARIGLQFDPRSGKLYGERAPYAGCEHVANLHCWVSVNRTRQGRLDSGMWNSENGASGMQITNAPSRDDMSRMHIFVVAPLLGMAREVLVKTLTGEIKPVQPWLI